MPNYCYYQMKIKGTKKSIEEVVKCLTTEYNYSSNGFTPTHRHFFRVFDCYDGEYVKQQDGTFSMCVSGFCAWSVYSCMCDGEHTYYEDIKKDCPDTCMGISLQEASKLYDCEIEVFSEEEGMEFTEHYIYNKGKCLVDKCVEMVAMENPNFNENEEEDFYENPEYIMCNPLYFISIEEQVKEFCENGELEQGQFAFTI